MTDQDYGSESRLGQCEICGEDTALLAWNRKFHEWDFVCRRCQEELGLVDGEDPEDD